jgi:hypothetical protein
LASVLALSVFIIPVSGGPGVGVIGKAPQREGKKKTKTKTLLSSKTKKTETPAAGYGKRTPASPYPALFFLENYQHIHTQIKQQHSHQKRRDHHLFLSQGSQSKKKNATKKEKKKEKKKDERERGGKYIYKSIIK